MRTPSDEKINRTYHIYSKKIKNVEYLIGYEGNTFAYTGNMKEDLLSITAVHPMDKEAVNSFLSKGKADWSVVHRLIAQDQLEEIDYKGKKFYMG